MKSLLYTCAFLLVCLAIGVASCSRPPQPIKVAVDPSPPPAVNPYQAFADSVRFTETARAGEDWTRIRSAFGLLKGEFAKPETIQKMRAEATRNRPFLESGVHLTEAELAEVELPTFTTADAHYLDECFLLRDVHRSIEVNDLAPLAQADVHFRWVMRNVLLHEETDTMIPPAFTLRRGYGSALDRALVFLALLRQAQIEGCLIAVPETMPAQFLVGVPDSSQASALLYASTIGLGTSPFVSALAAVPGRVAPDIYLYDTRLGLPLKSKDQKRLLTLDEARCDPASLQAAQITPKQAETLEAWLVCPLHALAPRMQELQRGLSNRDTITLYLDAKSLNDDIGKAARTPVKVWNPTAKDKDLPNSPTRSLRMFLAKQEGGIDETYRAAEWTRSRIPFQTVMANLARIKLTEASIGKTPFQRLNFFTVELFRQYDLQAREMYLRGLHDAMVRRQERMALFARDDTLARLSNDAEFRKELAEWREKVPRAAADAEHNDPAVRAAALQSMQVLCEPDQFIRWLLEVNKEDKFNSRLEKTVLTKILAVGMRDYFDLELARSQACANHEAAVHAEAVLASLRAKGKPTADASKTAHDAWMAAQGSWTNSYLDNLSLDSMIKRRMEMMRKRQALGEIAQEFDQGISLLETLHQDVQKYFHARLCLAECIEHLEGTKASDDYLRHVKSEIKNMKEKAVIRGELDRVQKIVRPFPLVARRLDFLANDWTEQGNYYWMMQQIDRRITTRAWPWIPLP
jgi:hypothetical protein